MNKIHPWPPIVAVSITLSLIYTLCALLFITFPNKILTLFNYWFHGIDLTKITKDTAVNFSSFFIGLISIILFSALFTLIFVWIYNLCTDHCKKKGWI